MSTRINTKTKPVIHLKQGRDEVVLTNQTSGNQKAYKVHSVLLDPEGYPDLPVRLTIATPTELDDKGSAVIGYTERENVEVKA